MWYVNFRLQGEKVSRKLVQKGKFLFIVITDVKIMTFILIRIMDNLKVWYQILIGLSKKVLSSAVIKP